MPATSAGGATQQAETALRAAGFAITHRKRRITRTGVVVDFVATDAAGQPWHVLVGGSDATVGGGLDRAETVWRLLGRAAALRGRHPDVPVLVLTTRAVHGEAAVAVRAAGHAIVHDIVVMRLATDLARLGMYASGLHESPPHPGFW